MTALGITTLQLRIAGFKFSHTFIVCDRLPDTELLFGIDVQKKFTLSYAWDENRTVKYRMKVDFLPTLEAVNRRQMLLLWNQSLWYCQDTMASYLWRSKDLQLRDIQPTSSVIGNPKKGKTSTCTSLMEFITSREKHMLMLLSQNTATNTSPSTKGNMLDIWNHL